MKVNGSRKLREHRQNVLWLHESEGCLVLQVYLRPDARTSRIMGVTGKRLMIQLSAPKHQLSQALVQFIAVTLDITAAQINIVSGTAGQRKTVCVDAVTKAKALLILSPQQKLKKAKI